MRLKSPSIFVWVLPTGSTIWTNLWYARRSLKNHAINRGIPYFNGCRLRTIFAKCSKPNQWHWNTSRQWLEVKRTVHRLFTGWRSKLNESWSCSWQSRKCSSRSQGPQLVIRLLRQPDSVLIAEKQSNWHNQRNNASRHWRGWRHCLLVLYARISWTNEKVEAIESRRQWIYHKVARLFKVKADKGKENK